MKTGTDPVSETLSSSYWEFRAMDKVQKPGDFEYHANFWHDIATCVGVTVVGIWIGN
jgi:hypothetical protein